MTRMKSSNIELYVLGHFDSEAFMVVQNEMVLEFSSVLEGTLKRVYKQTV